MTIGIMAAMHDEIAELINLMAQHEHADIRQIGRRTFYAGQLEGHDCVLVLAGIGKVAAASTASTLIQLFGVSHIVFAGLAGGLAEIAQVGDVVIADRLVHHDMDARPLFPRYQIPLTGVTEFELPSALCALLQAASRDFFEHHIRTRISADDMERFGLHQPQAHIGMIISGDQFIGSRQSAAKLREELPQACAVEMEGAAVAQICYEHDVPCAIIRTISDRAEDTAHVDFDQFLKSIASQYSSAILRNYLARLPASMFNPPQPPQP